MKALFVNDLFEREFSENKRESLADKGFALPDGSYPIVNKTDLKNAIKAYGRAKDKTKAKRHIIKRAKALDAVNLLPEEWGKFKVNENEDLPEWVKNPEGPNRNHDKLYNDILEICNFYEDKLSYEEIRSVLNEIASGY